MTTRLALSLLALPFLAALTAPARAADAPPVGVVACQACHGTAGISPGGATPNLAGQKADYLAAQLAAFKRGDRKSDVMAAIAGQLAEPDMKALAQYWASLPGAAPEGHAPASAAIRSRMTLPTGFPQGFTLYETDDSPSDGTVVKRYANAAAVRAARAGQPLPSGAVLVSVTHARGADGQAGAVRGYSAMETRAGWGEAVPPLLRNGDWDYALFDGAGARRDGLNEAQCLACHKPMAADSHVFTMKALRAAAARPAG
jgi:cytochrome c553